MLRFLPILLMILYAVAMWRFSSWRLGRELSERSQPLDDPEIEAVVRRLGRAVGIPHLKANVYAIPTFNGLAAPDGRIFVTQGVLDQRRAGRLDPDEIGSIIAHELGHVALGHSRRRMIDWTGQNAARMALSMVISRFVPFIGPWVAGLATGLLAARLSRRDEFEADAFAAAAMRRAGVDPRAQIRMFEKLEAMAQPPGGFAWLLSHPPTRARIAAIESLHAAWDRKAGAPDAPDRPDRPDARG